jgi:hypothetical protein
MSSTYGIPEFQTSTTNIPDFTSDFDELLRSYIVAEYSLSDPAVSDMKFKVGFFDYKMPYEIAIIERDTNPPRFLNGRRRAYWETGMEINIRMKRLARSETEISPQLGYMEREIQRIVFQYRNQDILGIKDVVPAGGGRVYDGQDSYATSDWRSVVRVIMQYEKADIS